MAIWKDKVHRTSENKTQEYMAGKCTHTSVKASTQEQRTGTEAGNVW